MGGDRMKTTDWKFDFSVLPHWNYRNSDPLIFDEFFEIPQSDTLCCIYSIVEATMCNYVGFLAILKTKENPELFLNIAEGMNFSNNFSVNKKGNLLFLQPDLYNRDTKTRKRPILIIDTSKNIFSYFDTGNFSPSYKVVELNEDVFGIEADERQKKGDKRLRALSKKKIRLKRLKWHDLTDIHSLPEMIF